MYKVAVQDCVVHKSKGPHTTGEPVVSDFFEKLSDAENIIKDCAAKIIFQHLEGTYMVYENLQMIERGIVRYVPKSAYTEVSREDFEIVERETVQQPAF